MQSTNLRQIKAPLWQQAFLGETQVSCPIGRVMAIRRRKGQLLALVRGWGAGFQWRVCGLNAQALSFSCKRAALSLTCPMDLSCLPKEHPP